MDLLKSVRITLAIAIVAAVVGLAVYLHAQKDQSTTAGGDTDTGVPMVIEGLVRDVACPMQNHKSNATNFNLQCALACAKSGSPLIILTRTDEIYFPMSDVMPDPSQREKLMPFVGKFVRVTGTVYRRNGTRTIVIKEMDELKDVKLNTTLGDD
jgi:hypothetical protein